MKEYICKQELFNKIIELPDDIDMLTIGRVIGAIDILPAVKKADICREFFEELRETMFKCRDTSYYGMCDRGYKLLAEMEKKE